ncbi:MAG: AAA family ATPase [bacterium]|nr:AAA family ATPase [bacterium]
MSVVNLIAELADPACYRGVVAGDVEILQTHLSVVCLVGERVYKLKKAIALPFVDFTTLAARRRTCRDEVQLNRRLCPDVYLGTVALRREQDQLRFAELGDDEGDADLDVAVVMRRLPQDRMLDELLRSPGAVTVAMVEDIAVLVARFHRAADRVTDSRTASEGVGQPRAVARLAADNFTDLRGPAEDAGPDAVALLAALERSSAVSFERLLPELERRVAAGRVVDGHGDLHARNICMTTPPAIYDCLEFSSEFRCGDVAAEVAFLAMDLRYRGAPDLERAFVSAYERESGDERLRAILPTFCSYRAMVRAKVAATVASEPEIDSDDRAAARDSARRHVLLAAAHQIEQGGALWCVVSGPPASGKSTLCEWLGRVTGWPVVNTDLVRKELAGLPPAVRAGDEYYRWEFTRRTYGEVASRAAATPATVVLIDGNFPAIALRSRARAMAADAGARFALVHVSVDTEVAVARAADRLAAVGQASDAGPAIAVQMHRAFEVPTAAESPILLDGERAIEDLGIDVLTRLLER